MDKIFNAIQAFRKEQGVKKKSQVVSPDILEPVKKSKGQGSVNIAYKDTKVIKLNPELLEKNRIVAHDKNNKLSRSFDVLRTQVLKKMQMHGWKTLAITSPVEGCGKTMVGINLAMSIAHHTSTTSILIDFDLRRPSVMKYLGLPVSPSFNDVLAGDSKISESLINPGLERMVILPTAIPVKHSSEVLSSSKINGLIDEFKNRYSDRIVIFDLPPIIGTDDTLTMLSQVDCVLMVVGSGMVNKDELNEAMSHIDNEKLIGTVFNKSEEAGQKETYYGY